VLLVAVYVVCRRSTRLDLDVPEFHIPPNHPETGGDDKISFLMENIDGEDVFRPRSSKNPNLSPGPGPGSYVQKSNDYRPRSTNGNMLDPHEAPRGRPPPQSSSAPRSGGVAASLPASSTVPPEPQRHGQPGRNELVVPNAFAQRAFSLGVGRPRGSFFENLPRNSISGVAYMGAIRQSVSVQSHSTRAPTPALNTVPTANTAPNNATAVTFGSGGQVLLPLLHAMQLGLYCVAVQLLQAGADASALNDHGKTLLHVVDVRLPRTFGKSCCDFPRCC